MANLRALRVYLEQTPDEKIIEQIKSIRDVDQLKTLWEAGLKQKFQEVALDRINEVL